MARNIGGSKYSNTFEIQSGFPIDARTVVDNRADLTNPDVWVSSDGLSYTYNGMVVAVTSEHELWLLIDKSNITDLSLGWKQLDSGAAETVDIVNNLESDDINKALSAKQGKVLAEKIDDVSTDINNINGTIEVLTGDENTEGSIASKIKASEDNLTVLIDKVTEDVSTLSETVTDISTAIDDVKDSIDTAINDKLSKLTDVYIYKGSVDTYDELPSENVETGHVYNVVAANGNYPAGTNYAWNGESWDALGGSIDLSDYATKEYVNTSINNVVNSIDELTSSVEKNADDITTLTSDISDINSGINTINTSISKIDSSLGALKADIETLTGGEGTSISSQLEALKSELEDVYVKQTAYTNDVSKINTSISANTTNINTNSTAINTLNGDEETVGSVTHTVKTLLVDYVEKEDGKELISAEKLELIDTNAANIASLTTTVNVNSSAISTLTTNVSTNTSSITTINETLIANSSRITVVEDKLQWATLD